jgi:hypothetical protein
MQPPAHVSNPILQRQAPWRHVSAAEQTTPQPPQFSGSFRRFEHAPLHSVWDIVQLARQ